MKNLFDRWPELYYDLSKGRKLTIPLQQSLRIYLLALEILEGRQEIEDDTLQCYEPSLEEFKATGQLPTWFKDPYRAEE